MPLLVKSFPSSHQLGYVVTHDLNPRQMRRQRSPVDPALVSPGLPLQSRCIIGLRGKVRLGLLDVFETQQHLVFGQRFRPTAEAMPLQLLDDLTQPFVSSIV